MIEPLQGFGFRESNYERPNQNWECGWASEGEPCHIGPNSKGICQAYRECVPYKDEDRYRCARPANFGGSCEREHGGPLPNGTCSQRIMECQPVRTLRSRRQLFTMAVSAMALGVCLLMFGGSWGKSFSSPGELTLQHHSKAQTCKDCHSVADGEFEHGDFKQWVSGALTAEMSSGDTVRCLECHRELEPNHLSAHGLDREALAASSLRIGQASGAGAEPVLLALVEATVGNSKDFAGGLACARCHHEHRGRNFDLTQMTNAQCQSCHTNKFHSFSKGHPDFTNYPYQRRTRLYFDHNKHYGRHFEEFKRRIMPGSVTPSSCNTCHQFDLAGKAMLIRGFEKSCANCHAPQIEEDSSPGIAIINLPGLDYNTLREKKIDIGQWPEDAVGLSCELTPFMQLLVGTVGGVAEAKEKLHGVDLDDLGKASQEQLGAVADYVWAIKLLWYDLVQQGLQKRLAGAFGPDIAKSELIDLTGLLPKEVLVSAQRRWFPSLILEIEARRSGKPVKPEDHKSPRQTTNTSSITDRGWYLDDRDFSIRYRPSGHGDAFLRAWLEVSSRFLTANSKTSDPATRKVAAPENRRGSKSLVFLRIFDTLANPTASGQCMRCHTADLEVDGSLRINWFADRPMLGNHKFTRFSHDTHVNLRNCVDCHPFEQPSEILRPELIYRTEFIRRDWRTINTDPTSVRTSGFSPVKKVKCAECHTSRQAGDSCLKCHNYHIHR